MSHVWRKRQFRENFLPSALGILGGLIVVAAMLYVAGGWLSSSFESQGKTRDRPFVGAVWRDHHSGEENLRGEMSEDLIHQVLRQGLSRRTVQRLLGPPDVATQHELTYYLGEAPGFGGGEVDIFFDERKRVVRAKRVAFGGF